jgi:hypothetical protein
LLEFDFVLSAQNQPLLLLSTARRLGRLSPEDRQVDGGAIETSRPRGADG